MPWHLYEPSGLTLREILAVVDAYDQRLKDMFDWATRPIAWQIERAFSEKQTPFESFWNEKESDVNKVGEDLHARAEYMRAMLRKNGYLKN